MIVSFFASFNVLLFLCYYHGRALFLLLLNLVFGGISTRRHDAVLLVWDLSDVLFQ